MDFPEEINDDVNNLPKKKLPIASILSLGALALLLVVGVAVNINSSKQYGAARSRADEAAPTAILTPTLIPNVTATLDNDLKSDLYFGETICGTFTVNNSIPNTDYYCDAYMGDAGSGKTKANGSESFKCNDYFWPPPTGNSTINIRQGTAYNGNIVTSQTINIINAEPTRVPGVKATFFPDPLPNVNLNQSIDFNVQLENLTLGATYLLTYLRPGSVTPNIFGDNQILCKTKTTSSTFRIINFKIGHPSELGEWKFQIRINNAKGPILTERSFIVSPAISDVPTIIPTNTPIPTNIPANTPQPTNSPTPSYTPNPTRTPTSTNTPTPSKTPTPTPTFALGINAGGTKLNIGTNIYNTDKAYIKGSYGYISSTNETYSTTNNIQNQGGLLYKTDRFNMVGYKFDNIENGNYQVTLKFAEIYYGCQYRGCRKFDVSIQGTKVLSKFDVYANAQGGYKPVDKTFNTKVINNTLDIGFTKVTNSPKINAIYILKQ